MATMLHRVELKTEFSVVTSLLPLKSLHASVCDADFILNVASKSYLVGKRRPHGCLRRAPEQISLWRPPQCPQGGQSDSAIPLPRPGDIAVAHMPALQRAPGLSHLGVALMLPPSCSGIMLQTPSSVMTDFSSDFNKDLCPQNFIYFFSPEIFSDSVLFH